MEITRDVNTVTVDEINDALVIGFARLDRDGVPEEYVMLQRSLDPDEDEPGIDGVYVERDDQEFCGYGGIVRYVLQRDRALVELDERMGRALGGEEVWRHVTIRFQIDDSMFGLLREQLGRLFVDCACFVDQSERPPLS